MSSLVWRELLQGRICRVTTRLLTRRRRHAEDAGSQVQIERLVWPLAARLQVEAAVRERQAAGQLLAKLQLVHTQPVQLQVACAVHKPSECGRYESICEFVFSSKPADPSLELWRPMLVHLQRTHRASCIAVLRSQAFNFSPCHPRISDMFHHGHLRRTALRLCLLRQMAR